MKAIITDYDYTLSEKFMTVELLFLLEEKGVINGYIKEYTALRKDYSDGKKNYNEFVKADMDFLKKYLKNINYLDVIKIMREDFDIEKNIYDWSREIKEIFKGDDWLFVVISSTMDLCLEKSQEILDFDTYFCSSFEVKDKKFTGEFRCQVKSQEKGNYVKQLCKNLEKIIVVGDAPGDFEMMKYSDVAFLFEPNNHTLNEMGDLKCKVVDRNSILKELKKQL